MSREEEYPLYPELPEDGAKEAQVLVDRFKDQLKKVAEEAIGDLYCDVVCHIESDSWTNYRNHLMDGFKDYNNRKIQGAYDFKEIRQSIIKNHRDDLIADLNQDLLEQVERLKDELARERNFNNARF